MAPVIECALQLGTPLVVAPGQKSLRSTAQPGRDDHFEMGRKARDARLEQLGIERTRRGHHGDAIARPERLGTEHDARGTWVARIWQPGPLPLLFWGTHG